VAALRQCLELLGFETFPGNNSKGEPDLIAVTPSTSWKYQLAIEVKTKEKSEEEKVESVTQVMGDASVIEKKTSSKVFPVLITQKETFSLKAIEVAKSKVRVFPSLQFTELMDYVGKLIDGWSGLSATGKPQFVDSIMSHYELRNLFAPSENPVVTAEDIKQVTRTT